jgi:hypothetical protein
LTDILSPLRWLASVAIDVGTALVPPALVAMRCLGAVMVRL